MVTIIKIGKQCIISGEEFVIRVEKSNNPLTNYRLVSDVKNNPRLASHLANDSFYYPLDTIEIETINPVVEELLLSMIVI